MNPTEGDKVTFRTKIGVASGVIVKRNGTRLRISSGGGNQLWIELKDMLDVEAVSAPFSIKLNQLGLIMT